MATIQTSIRIYDGMTPALRGDYMDTAAFASQLGIRSGDAFKDNKETVAFANQLNKQFVIAGASQDEVRAAPHAGAWIEIIMSLTASGGM